MNEPLFDVRPAFLARMPGNVLEAIGLGVDDSYGEALRQCAEFRDEQARDLHPHYRRSLIDDRLLAIAGRFDLAARSAPNAIGNCSHVEIELDGIVLTSSAVESRKIPPREAIFREQLARSSQIEMFSDNASVVPAYGKLYAIIIHRGNYKSEHPEFLDIAFPDRECKEFVADSIDLVAQLASLRARLRPEDQVQQRHDLGLRRKQAEKEVGGDS